MDKQKTIEVMALLIVDDILLERNAEETAEHLVNKGYGNIPEALAEFALTLKSVFCPMCDYEGVEIKTTIDELLKEFVPNADIS